MVASINKMIPVLYLVVFALNTPAQAADLSQFEATCLDIGFKKKTEALSDCMLELMLRAKRADADMQAAQQKAYEQEQQYKHEAEARAIETQNQALTRRQALEVPEPASTPYFTLDRLSNILGAVGNGLQRMDDIQRQNYYDNLARQPHNINCQTFGNRTNCQQY
ncbi:MAG TPA: hypothetical protein VIF37_12945 [Methylobacter sp.]|jgi:hypothetical protein